MKNNKPTAPTLSKGIVAFTFKFDCDRFLRYRLSTRAERDPQGLAVPEAQTEKDKRPGIGLVTKEGSLWEAHCYDDICELAGNSVVFNLSDEIDKKLRRHRYLEVDNLQELLEAPNPPSFVIEASFKIPLDQGGLNALEQYIRDHPGRLDGAVGRPDLLWIEPFDGSTTLLPGSTSTPEFVINIIDVKMAAEPSLRHFVEVTFYAFGLQSWLREVGLHARYAVAAAGRVWPGTHDRFEFKHKVNAKAAAGSTAPLREALVDTTHTVPHEAYWPRVREFLNERVPTVLEMGAHDTSWHVSAKCQLCEYSDHCRQAATGQADHLSQLPGLSAGQVVLLQQAGIGTLSELRREFESPTGRWSELKAEHQKFRAEDAALRARVQALATKAVVPISKRKTTLMPRWASRQIYLTTHFDPGTGLSFVFGARSVYFPPDRQPGDKPLTEEKVFLVDHLSAGGMADAEKDSFLEFCATIRRWLEETASDSARVGAENEALPSGSKKPSVSIQVYMWDQIEAKQLGRVLMRHMANEAVLSQAAFLLRFFPAEKELRETDSSGAPPVTIVRPIVKQLLALPEPFDYGIWRTRYWLHSQPKGREFLRPRYGFQWDLSDQIPFERAYELWHREILLTHAGEMEGTTYKPGRKYDRPELMDGLRQTASMFTSALEDIVRAMQTQHGDRLLLRKDPFQLAGDIDFPKTFPKESREMLVHAKLNAVAADLENRELLARPIEEREASFYCIRDLVQYNSRESGALIDAARQDRRYVDKLLLSFRFSEGSRDTRLKEGDFLLVLRNEDSEADINDRWYTALGCRNRTEAMALPFWPTDPSLQNAKLRSWLQVSIARLDTVGDVPLIVVAADPGILRRAQEAGLVDLDKPLVLDPYTRDFNTVQIDKALRALGPIDKKKSVRAASKRVGK